VVFGVNKVFNAVIILLVCTFYILSVTVSFNKD